MVSFSINSPTHSSTHRSNQFEFQNRSEISQMVYPRVKVRIQEEDDNDFPAAASLSKQEKENQINSPPSIARIRKVYVKSPQRKSSSATKDVGTAKKQKHIGIDNTSNTKANSVPPPRAVLSSPDNDGMIGTRNKLSYARCVTTWRMRPVEQMKPAGEARKTENIERSSPSPSTRRGPSAGRILRKELKAVVQKQKAHIGHRKSNLTSDGDRTYN